MGGFGNFMMSRLSSTQSSWWSTNPKSYLKPTCPFCTCQLKHEWELFSSCSRHRMQHSLNSQTRIKCEGNIRQQSVLFHGFTPYSCLVLSVMAKWKNHWRKKTLIQPTMPHRDISLFRDSPKRLWMGTDNLRCLCPINVLRQREWRSPFYGKLHPWSAVSIFRSGMPLGRFN